MTLREISGELTELQALLESGEDDEECLKNAIEDVMYDFETKTDDYGTMIRNLEANVDLLAAEIKRLQNKKKVIENNIKRMKTAIWENMEQIGAKRIDGEYFTFSIRNNAPQLPEFFPTDKVPAEFWENPAPTIKRKELLKAVKDGEVEGIELVRTKSLQMR